jgi:hypothetical protein
MTTGVEARKKILREGKLNFFARLAVPSGFTFRQFFGEINGAREISHKLARLCNLLAVLLSVEFQLVHDAKKLF